MKHNLLKIAAVTTLALMANVAATDFRAPLTSLHGPVHYKFKKVPKKKWLFGTWTTAYYKQSDKAFAKHGFETKPLTNLLFGKTEFTLSEAFENGNDADHGFTEGRNPYLSLTKFAPRASYTEQGMNIGGSIVYPIWKEKGKVGIRASVPFKSIRVERDDETENRILGDQTAVIRGDARLVEPGQVISSVTAYKLDLLKNLKYLNATGQVVGLYRVDSVSKEVSIGQATYKTEIGNLLNPPFYGKTGAEIPFVVIKSGTANKPPSHEGGAMLVTAAADAYLGKEVADSKIRYKTKGASDLAVLAIDGSGPVAGDKAAAFAKDTDYTNLKTTDLWATTIHGINGSPIGTSESGVNFVERELLMSKDNLGYWLVDHGYMFQTNQLTSMGDMDAELFYEHTFSNYWKAEINGGIRIPTGSGGDKYTGNPYAMPTGNGGHVELKLGGFVAYQPLSWMNVKVDASYNFALEAKETRFAAFKLAKIKNVGPKADADVDWSYFKGGVDFNIWHPKTKEISTTLGYEFFYKTEDHITFKNLKTSNHWLGKRWTDAAGKMADAATAGTTWTAFDMNLDNGVARKNTESIAHKFHAEGTYYPSKYFEFFAGGAYTFAGQNMPRESEMYGGVNVRF